MSVMYVRDTDGNLVPVPSIRGAKGEKGADGTMTFADLTEEQKASLKGDKGDKGDTGATGPAGADGEDGYTPVKGTDYFTEADKEEMVNDVLAALPTWTGGSY